MKENFNSKKIPDVTNVAARINALTGDGALIAFTSHDRNGTCADLAAIPRNKKKLINSIRLISKKYILM